MYYENKLDSGELSKEGYYVCQSAFRVFCSVSGNSVLYHLPGLLSLCYDLMKSPEAQ
jgi:hypothetical protein